MTPIRVLLVDDERSVRRGLRMCLDLEPDIEVVGEAQDADSALRLARHLRPDVVVMDVLMPGTDGLAVTRAIQESVSCAVVVLSIHDDAATRARAAAAGASAFVAKHEAQPALVNAIHNAADSIARPRDG